MTTVPAELAVFVDALGAEGAIALFLGFGGSEIYVAERPGDASELVRVLGRPQAEALAGALGGRKLRCPTAKPWIARTLAEQGWTKAAIARKLHTTDVTVRKWLREPSRGEPGAKRAQADRIAAAQGARQLKLF